MIALLSSHPSLPQSAGAVDAVRRVAGIRIQGLAGIVTDIAGVV
jgi:hypothetical protein